MRRVDRIFLPAGGVGVDVIPDVSQGNFVADDVFEKIALPYRRAGGAALAVDPFGYGGFVRSHDCPDGPFGGAGGAGWGGWGWRGGWAGG